MNRLERIASARGWAALALLAAPLLVAGCAVSRGGVYVPPRTPPPQRQPERVVVVEPPRAPFADLSGDWELGGRGNEPPGQARGRERDQAPPGPARERGRDEGPPGQVRQEQQALAAGAAPRIRIVQDDHSLTVMREGAVPLTLSYDGRPVYFSDARGGTRGEASGAWRGRRFEIRWAFYGQRMVTETYELNGNGTRLTVRNRVAEGPRMEDRSVPRTLVYQRVSGRRP